MKRAGFVVLAVCLVTPTLAIADPTPQEAELATARALFEEGLAREDAKDWAGALERFKRVAQIRVTPQVLYNLALCYEHVGKLALAEQNYLKVAKDGESSADPAVKEVARLATARRKEIARRIPEVVFDAPSVPDLAVTLDGEAIPLRDLPQPRRVDPGSHELVVTRHRGEARRKFDTPAGSGRSSIAIPIPEDVPDAEGPSLKTVPLAAWMTGGAAVVSFGVALGASLSRSSAIDELDDACGPNRDQCPEDKRPVADRVETMTAVTNVALGVGVAATVATGAILYFTWKPPSKTAVVLTPTLGGLRLAGTF